MKFDSGKKPWDLLPWREVEQIVDILQFGAKKYSPESWKKLPDMERRYFAAAIRHLIANQGGEKIDPESGMSHLAHAACNILFLLWRENNEEIS